MPDPARPKKKKKTCLSKWNQFSRIVKKAKNLIGVTFYVKLKIERNITIYSVSCVLNMCNGWNVLIERDH